MNRFLSPGVIEGVSRYRDNLDGKAVAAIEEITFAETEQLIDLCFKTEILDESNGADIEFIDPLTNDGKPEIVAVHLITPTGVVRLN